MFYNESLLLQQHTIGNRGEIIDIVPLILPGDSVDHQVAVVTNSEKVSISSKSALIFRFKC